MRIKFIKDAKYTQNDPKLSREYKVGEEHDVSDDHGQRWIRRQAAVEVVKPKRTESPKPEPPIAFVAPPVKGK